MNDLILNINNQIHSISAKTWGIECIGNKKLINLLYHIDKSKINAIICEEYHKADFVISPLFDFEFKLGFSRLKADYYPFYNSYDINIYGEDICDIGLSYKDLKWGYELLKVNNKIIGTNKAGTLTVNQRSIIGKIENKLIQSKNFNSINE